MAKKNRRKQPVLIHPPAPSPATTPAPPKPKPVAPLTPAILLTVPQVCELLGGISRSTLTRMEKTGKIPGRVQIGGSVRYHREILEEWVRTLVK